MAEAPRRFPAPWRVNKIVRMKAAVEALPFERPKLAITAVVAGNEDFTRRLELCWERSARVMIEAPPRLQTDLRMPPTKLRRI